MTDKQAKFTHEFIKGAVNGKPNATAAAIKAGYSPKSAKAMAHQTLHDSPEVSFLIKSALKKRRLTLDRFCKVLDEGLEAKKMVGLMPFQPDGTLPDAKDADVDYVGVPDFSTRHKYLETGLKLHGLLQPFKGQDEQEKVAPPQPIVVLVHTSGESKTQVVIPMTGRNGD